MELTIEQRNENMAAHFVEIHSDMVVVASIVIMICIKASWKILFVDYHSVLIVFYVIGYTDGQEKKYF